MKKEQRYFNFPIQLLVGFLKNPDEVMENIRDYALYVYTLKDEIQGESNTMQMAAATSYFDISIANVQKSYGNGRMLFIRYGEGNPMTGLNKSIFLNFYGSGKPEFDYVCLLAFLACRSILSKKLFCKTNNHYLWSRMDGQAKQVTPDALSAEVRKYATPYQTRKIKDALKLNWHLKTYGQQTRGFYISFDMNLQALIFAAEEMKQSYRLKQYRLEEKAAKFAARAKLARNCDERLSS